MTHTTHTTTRNGARLTAQEATIQTAQVDISVIRVGKKHVTQAMFRQIPYAELIDLDTLALQGTPWGHVRYWWEGCLPANKCFACEDVLHVVWQDAAQLRRALIFERGETPRERALRTEAHWAEVGLFLLPAPTAQEGHPSPCPRPGDDLIRWLPDGRVEKLTYHDCLMVQQSWWFRAHPEAPQSSGPLWEAWHGVPPRATVTHAHEDLVTRWAFDGWTYEDCLRVLEAGQHEAATIRARYAALYAELCALPQLFIAV